MEVSLEWITDEYSDGGVGLRLTVDGKSNTYVGAWSRERLAHVLCGFANWVARLDDCEHRFVRVSRDGPEYLGSD